ncbi:hypothetical protein HanRHA438_Chr11g0498981 [Helianthus annuus]|nr:hypothetical protein HanRHA438_Chr11g0498981 [Helianthus annuus]
MICVWKKTDLMKLFFFFFAFNGCNFQDKNKLKEDIMEPSQCFRLVSMLSLITCSCFLLREDSCFIYIKKNNVIYGSLRVYMRSQTFL